MFILRRYTGESSEINQSLGDSYVLVKKDVNFDAFKETYSIFTEGGSYDLDSPISDNIYMFIVCKKGSEVIPLYRPSTYYIMTENGATFANLTFK